MNFGQYFAYLNSTGEEDYAANCFDYKFVSHIN